MLMAGHKLLKTNLISHIRSLKRAYVLKLANAEFGDFFKKF